MPWFRVDDGFHSHPKVLVTSLAARGLWVTAGSWSSAHLTDGVVPDHALALLGGTPELAEELVTSGLWKRRRGGYQFHDWHIKNPSKRAVEKKRRGNAERQKRWRDEHSNADRNAVTNAVTNRVTNSAPAQPSPYKGSVVTDPVRGGSPNARPNEHLNGSSTPAARHPSARTVQQAIADATPDAP